MSVPKYLLGNLMSYHFSYAMLTPCLRPPSFGLRGGIFWQQLTRSLRDMRWTIFDSPATTGAYAKTIFGHSWWILVRLRSEEENDEDEPDEADTGGRARRERLGSRHNGQKVRFQTCAYENLTRSLRGAYAKISTYLCYSEICLSGELFQERKYTLSRLRDQFP